MTRLALSAAALAAILLFVLAASPRDSHAQATTIDVGSDYFCAPAFENSVCETTVAVGSAVTWQVSGGVHTVTQCDASFTTCPPGGGFDSGLLSGGTYAQTFNSPGTVPYWCAFHPNQMRGRILVQSQPTATTAPTATASPGAQTPPVVTPPSATAVSGPAEVPSGGGQPSANSIHQAIVLGVGLLVLGVLIAISVFTVARDRRR